MSREAWGDDGDPPTCWEETAMRQEFDGVDLAFGRWAVKYEDEVGSPDLAAAIQAVRDAFENLGEGMVGKL